MADNNYKVRLRDNKSFVSTERFSDIFHLLDPEWLSGEWGNIDPDIEHLPDSLTLRIADNEDVDAIEDFFNSRRKQEADPKGFVKPRPDDPVEDLASNGRIILIEDNEGITALCFAFTHEIKPSNDVDTKQKVTEIGTVISCTKGLGLTAIAISAISLVLKEQEGIDHPIIAKVSKKNDAANNLFGSSMAWNTIDNYYEIRPLFTSSAGDTIRSDNENHSNYVASTSRNWYVFEGEAQEKAADLINTLRQDEALDSQIGKTITFHFDDEDFDFYEALNKIVDEESELHADPDDMDQHLNLNPDDEEYLSGTDDLEEIPTDSDINDDEVSPAEHEDSYIYDEEGNVDPISSSKIYSNESNDNEYNGEEDDDDESFHYSEEPNMP